MDPITNPYAPGAGAPPPELAGRDALIEQVRIATERVRIGRQAKSVLMIGLRGVGKTVLLDRMRSDAEAAGIETLRIEAPEGRSLPAMLAPQLRLALLRLSRREKAGDLAARGLRALAGFAKSLKLKFADLEVGIDLEPEPGLADNGDLEHDLQALLEAAGEAAQAVGTVLALYVDELQYVPEDQLAPLITALHRCAQRQVPVMLVGAGLPQLPGQMGRAKSYAERLFAFHFIGPLDATAARDALEVPAAALGVRFEPAATEAILRATEGYPYFLQEWGKHAWDVAPASPITRDDRTRPGPAPLRRRGRGPRPQGHRDGAHPRAADRKGHGLEPQPRRHRVHRADVRCLPAPDHARRGLARGVRAGRPQLRRPTPRCSSHRPNQPRASTKASITA
ncbi:MAG: hypothetical protein KatS3mg127_0442 [Silanimonas sp.]|nr:MAG: hypothetical protein KatS3mg127_0442 [Silanimonas sp.]